MSGFSADWLALREPADHAARSRTLTELVTRDLLAGAPVRIVDLGCGTGSNLRYLAPSLPVAQQWRLVDHDAGLLAAARAASPGRSDTRLLDLDHIDDTTVDGATLVTSSALLDLVSEAWLGRLVRLCRGAGARVLMVLNYDGRLSCTPEDDDDGFVRELVNRHQRGDKGLGPALGPDSGARCAALLAAAGYTVTTAKSDWMLGPDDAELQRQLVAGWAHAAVELAPADASRIHAWEARRRAHIDGGHSLIVVGHDDVAGVL
jgi:SAM-dependent methyltransferase